jgi:hypothetical protein
VHYSHAAAIIFHKVEFDLFIFSNITLHTNRFYLHRIQNVACCSFESVKYGVNRIIMCIHDYAVVNHQK